jgi:alpha-tubulin suppressor-like RCC1 family protein
MRHSAVISEDGKLYMFGSGNWGVLGQGNEKDVRFDKPIQVTKFEKLGLKVVDCCLGEYHSMVLTDDGSVWTWGYAGKKGMFNWMYSQEVGALGHGDKEPQFIPKKVEYFAEHGLKIKSIAAGLYHCNALTE